ncbi:DNA phosphorothioation-dependent restriction protein DptF [Saccharibacillus sp. CPCC 101409]|uniref:DNA phosphorothioation-dependent restriction protein DptF n=1 Tax=Saccharibacillus sp. CPCC 101409 TaxID=3058041 RepID=UPI00267150FC|nr:DNA phosphorothioation-dependent restriction protein DptF [Saccharibacillus sp. CPCC 101409]MDO3408379.1 DNA phosphorothioation-dependent restriction protein DptF [Saccharibacillus sp. CPCC 101409]
MTSSQANHLINILKRCKQSSKEAVENLESFSDFKQYMHIQRPVEVELEQHINEAHSSAEARLILVCGGVGDGKSHILSYLKNKYSFLNDESLFYLHNDATESFSPKKTSIETLAKVLQPFSDEGLQSGGTQNIVLAINLGALNNFIDSEEGKVFSRLRAYVYQKKILESVIADESSPDDHIFQYVNFSDYHMYQLTADGPKSNYIKGIFRKVTQQTEDNPFYQAYLRDREEDSEIAAKNPIMQNYELLQNEDVQDKIITLLIQVMVKEKLIISTRALLDFVYNLLVPSVMENMSHKRIVDYVREQDFQDYIACLLPFQIFEKVDASAIHQAIDRINPTRMRTEQLDKFLIEFKSNREGAGLFANHISITRLPCFSRSLFQQSPWRNGGNKEQAYKQRLIKLFVYLYYFIPKEPHQSFEDKTYEQFMRYLFYWNKHELRMLARLYQEDIRDAIYKWNGEANNDLVYVQVGQPQTQYYALQKLEIEPHIERANALPETELFKFLTMMKIQFRTKGASYADGSEVPTIDIDYSLYSLLNRIKQGYRPNKKDKFQYIKFVEFIDKLNNAGTQKNEMVFESKQFGKSTRYRLQYDETFDQYSFMET